jgi:hypothetical protein
MNRAWVVIPIMALLVSACGVIGGEIRTDVGTDEKGTFDLELGFAVEKPEDKVNCNASTDLPPGAIVTTEDRGDSIWCTISMPFSNLAQLEELYRGLFKEAMRIDCLTMDSDRLIYDVSLISQASGSDKGEASIPWRVTVPGEVGTNNADEVNGQTLTWYITAFTGTKRLQINVPEDGLCPTGVFDVYLLTDDDGTGTAQLTAPLLKTDAATAALVDALRSAGWRVETPASRTSGQKTFKASLSWNSEDQLAGLASAIPPLAGSDSTFGLNIVEDNATKVMRFDFNSRLDMSKYTAYWKTIDPDSDPPPFRFTYSPPGNRDTVSGAWSDTIALDVVWKSDSTVTRLPLRAVSILEPQLEQEVSPSQVEANLETIKSRFGSEIPVGQIRKDPSLIQSILMTVFSAGTANNMTNWETFACGDYQTRVLDWLDKIRTDPDPAVRAQLAGLDYGPVQAYRGGHQAVVLFPRGTDWHETGTVLDPWPNQRPETFSIVQWGKRFTWGIGVGEGGGEYPHLYGNPPRYPGVEIPSSRAHPRRIGLNSPVAAMVTASDGRRIGRTADGEWVNEIDGADFYAEPRGGEAFSYYFGLPGGDYQLTMVGTADGDFHVLVADENGDLVTYGPQAIGVGETATLPVTMDTIEQRLELPSGETVEPIAVTDDNVADLDFGPAEETAAAVNMPPMVRFGYLALLAACGLIPLGGGMLFWAWRGSRGAKSAD